MTQRLRCFIYEKLDALDLAYARYERENSRWGVWSPISNPSAEIKNAVLELHRAVESDPEMLAEIKTFKMEYDHRCRQSDYYVTVPFLIHYGARFDEATYAGTMTMQLLTRSNSTAIDDIVKNDTLGDVDRETMIVYTKISHYGLHSPFYMWLEWLLSFDEPSLRALSEGKTHPHIMRDIRTKDGRVKEMVDRYEMWLSELTGAGIVVCAFGGGEWTDGSWRIAQFMLHFKKT